MSPPRPPGSLAQTPPPHTPSSTRRAPQPWATPSRWHSCPGKVAPRPGDLLATPVAPAGPSSLPSRASPSRQASPHPPHLHGSLCPIHSSRSSTIPAPPLQSSPHALPAHPPKTTATGTDSSPGAVRWARPCHLPLPFCLPLPSAGSTSAELPSPHGSPGGHPLSPGETPGWTTPAGCCPAGGRAFGATAAKARSKHPAWSCLQGGTAWLPRRASLGPRG